MKRKLLSCLLVVSMVFALPFSGITFAESESPQQAPSDVNFTEPSEFAVGYTLVKFIQELVIPHVIAVFILYRFILFCSHCVERYHLVKTIRILQEEGIIWPVVQ